jgi:hypothetical protein
MEKRLPPGHPNEESPGEKMTMKTTFAFLLLLSFLVIAPLPAWPETVTYTCQYETYGNEKGLHKVVDDFKLVFVVDTSKEAAQLISSRGKFNVELLPAPHGGMTLVEMVDGGKVLSTSIDKFGKSVHSRNIILEGQISPSQYYGTCSKR